MTLEHVAEMAQTCLTSKHRGKNIELYLTDNFRVISILF